MTLPPLRTDLVQVRFAKPKDCPRLCELDCVPGEKATRRLVADQRYIIAEHNIRAIGLIRLEHIWTVVPYMGLIWIEPDFRKRGLSRRLLSFVCDHLRREGHKTLFSSSQANEPEPQAWHRHVGFVDSGCIECINDDAIDEVMFRLSLTGDASDK